MDYLKNITKLSVKNFISDLPATLNVFFESIKRTFNNFYDASTNTVNADTVNVTGNMQSNSITTNFFTVKNVDGRNITIADIDASLDSLQDQMNTYKESVSSLLDPIPSDTVQDYINAICR